MMTRDVQTAADLIRGGGLVAVPTETVYGLAGSGLSEAAGAKALVPHGFRAGGY